jgi:type I restriction enzyme M protein
MLDIKTLETWLLDTACGIRAVDAPNLMTIFCCLFFIKRISDVFEDELKRLSDELEMKGLLMI